jgi:hypothetical protein
MLDTLVALAIGGDTVQTVTHHFSLPLHGVRKVQDPAVAGNLTVRASFDRPATVAFCIKTLPSLDESDVGWREAREVFIVDTVL